jgi:hypothetical protein
MIPHKYATIMSGLVVRWRFSNSRGDAEINASLDGVSICGCWPIMQPEALAEVVTTLGAAVSAHARIKTGDDLPDIPSAHLFEKAQPTTPGLCEKHLDDDGEILRW